MKALRPPPPPPPRPPGPVAPPPPLAAAAKRLEFGARAPVLCSHMKTFETPEDLWQAFLDYAADVNAAPLLEEKVFASKGTVIRTKVAKMRAMTLQGFSIHAGFHRGSLNKWRNRREDLRPVIAKIEDAIYNQKFTGAAAGLLNPHFIGRALGIAEKVELQQQAAVAPPAAPEKVANLIHPDCTDEQLEAIYAAGKQPILYTQEQLEAGMPHILPAE
ncbi:terminase small subunit [Pukyongiella litopenaei]|uniref:Uncharacterized protein n=1 Tax=Pukyongiella litopenaei TaxID=2605946 RepID=A0A2S0MN47_9RHOB|nr:terminase small subunit [Pukyongiella litopenaei]AVO37309.1 hypothetical protein C6Y53_06015 [Pukyongiella litopenaei]